MAARKPSILMQWLEARNALAAVKPLVEKERDLRKAVIDQYFPSPVEGNQYANVEGKALTLQYPYVRTVDEASLDALLPALKKAKVSVDDVIVYKPAIDTRVYRELTKAQRNLLDRALTIKPGSSSLTIKDI